MNLPKVSGVPSGTAAPCCTKRSRVSGAMGGVAARAFTALAENVRDYAIFLINPDGTIDQAKMVPTR